MYLNKDLLGADAEASRKYLRYQTIFAVASFWQGKSALFAFCEFCQRPSTISVEWLEFGVQRQAARSRLLPKVLGHSQRTRN
jgi:hypothetical protein